MHALIWLASGLGVGWLARGVMRQRGYGLLSDLLLGMLGGIVGGWVVRQLGLSDPTDILRHVFVSLVGAVVVLAAARWVRPVALESQKLLGEVGIVTDLEAHVRRLGEFERQLFERLLRRERTLRDPNAAFDAQMTFGQRVADRVAKWGGSWTFIGVFLLLMVIWMVINTETRLRFDPYPFILLNLALSCVAAMQAPVIMMSQNRLAEKDRMDAHNDYEVNLRAELEIQKLHAKLDQERAGDWNDLLELQRRQLDLLEQIARRLEAGGAR